MVDLSVAISDFVVIFAITTLVVTVFHFLKQPAISGFIFTGAIIGPTGFKLVSNENTIHNLAEIGVILVMFSLGVEFSFKKIREMAVLFLGLGSLQCLLTTLVFTGLFYLLGNDALTSFVIGSMLSLSSTTIVIKILQQRRETSSPHGNTSIAILLFQDLWVVPILILIPYLGKSHTGNFWQVATETFSQGLTFFAGVIIASRYLVPWLIRMVVRTQVRELFTAFVALLSLGTALISYKMGLSMALGAFLGGIIISQTEFGHQAVADVIPLRDLFIAIFFISIGMLLDLHFLIDHFPNILLVGILILIIKFVITATSAALIGVDSRVSAIVGIMLAQIGEFSFVIGEQSRTQGILSEHYYQFLLSITLILMTLTPLIIHWAPKMAPHLSRLNPLHSRRLFFKKYHDTIHNTQEKLNNHVVIIGFGINGQILSKSFHKLSIPHCVIELSHPMISKKQLPQSHIIFGDASKKEILEAAGIFSAQLVIVTINDYSALKQVLSSIKKISPDISVLVRVTYLKDAIPIFKDVHEKSDVIISEIAGGKELLMNALQRLKISENEINDHIHQDFHENYRKEII